MSSKNIATITKMMESLPDSIQERVVEHLQEYILILQEEKEWDKLVDKSQTKLVYFAKKAKQEIAEKKIKMNE